MPSPTEIQRHLRGVSYPATRDDLTTAAEDEDAPTPVVDALEALEDREYESPADVMEALGDSDVLEEDEEMDLAEEE